ncbi:hypothetical protein ACFL1U_01825, partial [Patescibacteria group bacterium]
HTKSKIEDKVGKRIKAERLKKVKLLASKDKDSKLAPPPEKKEETDKPDDKKITKNEVQPRILRRARIIFWSAIGLIAVLGLIPAALIIWPEYIDLGTDFSLVNDVTNSDVEVLDDNVEIEDLTTKTEYSLISEMVGDLAALPFDFSLPSSWHVYGDLDMLLPGSKEYGTFLQVDARPILSGSTQNAILQGISFANGTAVDTADSREQDLKVDPDISGVKRSAVSLGGINAVRISYTIVPAETGLNESYFEYYLDDTGHNLSYYFVIQTEGTPYFKPFSKNLEFASLFEENFEISLK